MCVEANHFLSEDMKEVFEKAVASEKSPLGCQVLGQLKENLKIAGEDMIPSVRIPVWLLYLSKPVRKFTLREVP